jgi:hypothetical protein
MHRMRGLMMTAAGLTALTACGTATPETAPAPAASPAVPVTSPAPAAPSSAAPAAGGPRLTDANLAQLKNYDVDLGVPVAIGTTLDAGEPKHYLGSHPDGSVDFTGTAVNESTRMTIRPAKVRKRTDDNRNTVVLVATPKIAGSGPESCVSDNGVRVLRLEPCRPGDAAQSWKLTPEGDSGLFSLHGRHTGIEVNEGRMVAGGGWAGLETTALA